MGPSDMRALSLSGGIDCASRFVRLIDTPEDVAIAL